MQKPPAGLLPVQFGKEHPAEMKTPKKQLEYVKDWERRNPEQSQARKNAWAKSPAGKKWLAKNQKKKNRRRDVWRKRKRLEAKKAKSGNDGTQRGRDDDAPPATETQSRPSLK